MGLEGMGVRTVWYVRSLASCCVLRSALTQKPQVSFCCTPCGLAQMETEIRDRAEKALLLPGHEKQPYQQQPGMAYQQPIMAAQPLGQEIGVTRPPPEKGQ